MEVMEAANQGKPMPRPIEMAPIIEKKEVIKDGMEIAKSLRKKREKGKRQPGKTSKGR